MALPFATKADLVARWRTLTASEDAVADMKLAAASRKVRAECTGIDALIESGKVDKDLVTDIVCQMVIRALMNSETAGASSIQQTAGPFSQSTSYANPTGDLYLLKGERRQLGFGGQVAFTIDLGGSSES